MINFGYESLPLTEQEFNNLSLQNSKYDKDYHDGLMYQYNGPSSVCRYDSTTIVSLKTIINDNNIKINVVTTLEAISQNKKFVYPIIFARWEFHNNFDILDAIPQHVINAIETGQCLLILSYPHELGFQNDSSSMFSMYRAFRKRNFKLKNILVLVNTAYNKGGNLGKYYKVFTQFMNFKLVDWEYFETSTRICNSSLNLSNKCADSLKLKKFICLIRRPKLFRCMFMYEMYSRQLLKNFTMSFPKEEHIVGQDHELVGMPTKWYNIVNQDDYKSIYNSLPWVHDTEPWTALYTPPDVYNNHLINVVCETHFGGDSGVCFITEKTFKPISYKMPFIIVGDPGTLAKLKQLGYKTFSDYWDESYDTISDRESRMNAICQLVEDLSKKTVEELQIIIKSMKLILDHNHKVLMSNRAEQEFINALKDFACK